MIKSFTHCSHPAQIRSISGRTALCSLLLLSICWIGIFSHPSSAFAQNTHCFEHSCDGLPLSSVYQAGAQPYGSPVDLTESVQQDSLFYPFTSQVVVGQAQLWLNPTYHVLWTQATANALASVQDISSISADVWISQPQLGRAYSLSNTSSGPFTGLTPTLTSPLQGYHPGEGQSYAPAGYIATSNGGIQSTAGPAFTP